MGKTTFIFWPIARLDSLFSGVATSYSDYCTRSVPSAKIRINYGDWCNVILFKKSQICIYVKILIYCV